MSVEIKRVESKRDLKHFIDFHYDLYKGNPYDAPVLFIDDMNTLRKDKNVAFDFCEAEYFMAYKDGKFKEMFASGTAAVISPVGELRYKDEDMIINNGEIGPIAQELYDTIYGIQTGKLPDDMGWTVEVK